MPKTVGLLYAHWSSVLSVARHCGPGVAALTSIVTSVRPTLPDWLRVYLIWQ